MVVPLKSTSSTKSYLGNTVTLVSSTDPTIVYSKLKGKYAKLGKGQDPVYCFRKLKYPSVEAI